MPNISRSKGNQTMKSGQSTECNMRNIFLEKSYTKCGRETRPRPYSKKLKLSISLDQSPKFLYKLVLLFAKLRAIKIYWNWTADLLLLPHIKIFWKIKRGLELVNCLIFCITFEKMFLLLYCINWPSFIFWLPLLREILGNMCVAIAC